MPEIGMMVLLQEALHIRNLQMTKSARNLCYDIATVCSTDKNMLMTKYARNMYDGITTGGST